MAVKSQAQTMKENVYTSWRRKNKDTNLNDRRSLIDHVGNKRPMWLPLNCDKGGFISTLLKSTSRHTDFLFFTS